MQPATLPASSPRGSACKQENSFSFMICEARLCNQHIYICLTTCSQRPRSHLALATALGAEMDRLEAVNVGTILHEDTIAVLQAPAQTPDGAIGDLMGAAEELRGCATFSSNGSTSPGRCIGREQCAAGRRG